MLDEFRQQASASYWGEEEEPEQNETPEMEIIYEDQPRRHFLGMTPVQRFIIATLLFVLVCLVGSLALLVTDKVVLPFGILWLASRLI